MPARLKTYLFVFVAVVAILTLVFVSNPTLPAKTTGYLQSLVGHPGANPGTSGDEIHNSNFSEDRWFFQNDLENVTVPNLDVAKFRHYPPHNYKGPGHETYATFYASRNGSLLDPYFVGSMQMIWRLLWNPETKSKHPVTVFVAPFISQEHRDFFSAAGAVVRELGLRHFEPSMYGVPARLKDMFSKLEMWRQTDFTRIFYLDSDAFPYVNIDPIFDLVPMQTCNQDLLDEEDKVYSSICTYSFAGHMENIDTVNAGVMMLKPDHAMYARLVRESNNTDDWDTGYLEQAFLSHVFHPTKSAFPVRGIGPEWNAFWTDREKGVDIKILHDKMWAHPFEPGLWVTDDWHKAYADMLALYESEEFERSRNEDRERVLAEFKNIR